MIEVHASEIHALRTCERKWHGIYVGGQKEPDSEATARGTAIHSILESYLDGKGPIDTTTDYGQIAASGLKYLPTPGTVHTELDFAFPPAADGWFYAGTIDMIRPFYVGDHKTTSNFKYQKNQATLITDPQAVLYGTVAQQDGKSDIECQWIYYRTSGAKKAQETRFIYPGQLLVENKAKLDEEVRAAIKRRSLPFLDLTPNPSVCFKYGKPCHVRHKCTDLRPTIGQLMSQSRDDLLASLKAKAQGAAAANPAGVAMPPPATVATPPAGLPALPSLAAPAPAAATAPAPVSPPAGLPALPSLAAPAAAAAAPVAAAPPTGLPSLPSLPGVPAVTPPPPAQTTLPAIDPAVMAAAAAEAAAKAAKAAKPAPAAMPPLPAPPGPPAPAAQAAPSPDLSGQYSIGTLYIDCLPMGQAVKHFSEVATLCHDGIRETLGLAHYKMGDFGKGLGFWVEAVKLFMGADPQANLFVDTASGDGRDALEALIPMASKVIRGIK